MEFLIFASILHQYNYITKWQREKNVFAWHMLLTATTAVIYVMKCWRLNFLFFFYVQFSICGICLQVVPCRKFLDKYTKDRIYRFISIPHHFTVTWHLRLFCFLPFCRKKTLEKKKANLYFLLSTIIIIIMKGKNPIATFSV